MQIFKDRATGETVRAGKIIAIECLPHSYPMFRFSLEGGATHDVPGPLTVKPKNPEYGTEGITAGDIIVVNDALDVSFHTASEFGEKFVFADAQGIGWAMKQMENGSLVRRVGWNGKGMFIFLVPGSNFVVNRAPLNVIFPEGTAINYRPHVDMKTADGQIVPWVCSQSDLLATDWEFATA